MTTEQERMRQAVDEKREEARTKAEEQQLDAHERPQDDKDPRAKGSGHKKMTADKWNQ